MTDLNNITADLSKIAATPMTGNRMQRDGAPNNWFEAFATAWGKALDDQAAVIEQKSSALTNDGTDNPSQITMLTTESLKMSFLANSSQSSIDSVGKALETMARKS
jgi:hypothetical protein